MHQDQSTRRLRRARVIARPAHLDIRSALRIAISVSMLAAVLYAFKTLA
jgi:hypothetical protein